MDRVSRLPDYNATLRISHASRLLGHRYSASASLMIGISLRIEPYTTFTPAAASTDIARVYVTVCISMLLGIREQNTLSAL